MSELITPQVTIPERTATGARRRVDTSLVGQLNLEWARRRVDPAASAEVLDWATRRSALKGCTCLADVESRISSAGRERADAVLLALLELAAEGEDLAGRTVLQMMLGKAVRIAAAQTGRANRDLLEQLAVSALWDVIATYPIHRRRQKVAANLAMDTLRQVVGELAPDRVETPVEPGTATVTGRATEAADEALDTVADLELLEVLAWGVDAGVLSRDDATLLVRVYSPAPGESGGAEAAATLGLSWPAARQRCSRAVRRLAAAVRDDHLAGLTAQN